MLRFEPESFLGALTTDGASVIAVVRSSITDWLEGDNGPAGGVSSGVALFPAAGQRRLNRRTPTETKNPMLGVGYCRVCGASLAQQISRWKNKDGVNVHRYYRCGRTPLNCNGVSIKADFADELLEQTFLERWGTERVTRKVFVPGEDHTHELEQVNATIDRLRRESDAGLVVSADDERVYLERMKALIDRRTKLEEVPMRSAGWITEKTDDTHAEAWEVTDHRKLLVDARIRFELKSGNPLNFHLHDEGVSPVNLPMPASDWHPASGNRAHR